MEGSLVRAVLGLHLARRHAGLPVPAQGDPNALVESWTLAEGLARVAGEEGEPALRQAASDYVALWARTFRTLVTHLRGRPERALSLFCSEVYPYLRGDRLAARVDAVQPGHARVLLQADLPAAYLAGLVEAFVGLSGAEAHAKAEGAGAFSVRYRLQGRDRLARLVQDVAAERLQMVVCALLAAGIGLAVAARVAGPLSWWRLGSVLAGTLAVQLGANALHDLRHPHPAGPLDLRARPRQALLRQARLGYGAAALCGLALAWQAPAVLAFAAAGLAASALFGHIKNKGWGPLVAGLIYGPLLADGALVAAAPQAAAATAGAAVTCTLLAIPAGALAAAVLYIDDLADRPLDEAGGSRTLLVRLPERRHLVGYAALVLGGVGVLAAALSALGARTPFLDAALVAGALVLVSLVRRNLDNPRGLAPARFGTLLLHAACAGLLMLAVLGVVR